MRNGLMGAGSGCLSGLLNGIQEWLSLALFVNIYNAQAWSIVSLTAFIW